MCKDRLTDKEDCNSRFAECEGTYSLSSFFPEFALNRLHFLNAIFPSSLKRKTAYSSEKLLPTYRGHSDIGLKNTVLIKIQQFIPKSQNFLSSACYKTVQSNSEIQTNFLREIFSTFFANSFHVIPKQKKVCAFILHILNINK
jgi:hypothetical protein